jgi:hypothetical protein
LYAIKKNNPVKKQAFWAIGEGGIFAQSPPLPKHRPWMTRQMYSKFEYNDK